LAGHAFTGKKNLRCPSGSQIMINAASRFCLGFGKLGVVSEKGRAIGADFFAVRAEVDVDMWMVKRRVRPYTHEFLDADFDGGVSGIILEVGDCVARHGINPVLMVKFPRIVRQFDRCCLSKFATFFKALECRMSKVFHVSVAK
jgi:hypothetical protein